MNRPSLPRPAASSGARFVPIGSLVLLAVVPLGAYAADSTRAVPASGLAAYVEYHGLAAHADAWKSTAAFAALQKTPAGAMTLDVARQVIDRLLRSVPPEARPSTEDLLSLQGHIVRHGFSAGLYDEKGITGVFVLRGLASDDARGWLNRLLPKVRGEGHDDILKVVPRLKGRDVYTFQARVVARGEAAGQAAGALVCWFEGDDLIGVVGPMPWASGNAKGDEPATLADRITTVLETIDGKTESVARHPGRIAALAEETAIPGFEQAGHFFVELARMKALYDRTTVAFGRYEGITLPAGRYMHDDVQYFPPGPDFPWANTQAATQRARMLAMGIEPEATRPFVPPTPPVPLGNEANPASLKPIAPPSLPRSEGKPALDRDATKAGMLVKQPPQVSRKTPASTDGVGGITRVVGRWGFHEKALLADIRVEAPAPRRGMARLLDQPGFPKDHLPPMPRATRTLLVGSLDGGKVVDMLIDQFTEEFDLESETVLNKKLVRLTAAVEFEELARESIGVGLREDLLAHLGSTWSCYAPTAGKTRDVMPVVLVDLKDAEAFGPVLDRLAAHVNGVLKTAGGADHAAKNDEGEAPELALERIPGPERGYRLRASSGLLGWLGEGHEPTILIDGSHLVLAAGPAQAREALEAASKPAEDWVPTGDLARAFGCLPDRLTSLSVGDPRDSTWPDLMANLPRLVQSAATLLEARRRDGSSTSPASALRALVGMPRPDGFRLRIDPARLPAADDLRAELVPSVMATTVDKRGFRLIVREAVPFACVGPSYEFSSSSREGETLGITFHPFLLPMVRAEVKHVLETDKVSLSFGVRGGSSHRSSRDD